MTEEIKFEKALERLEKIVEDLEAGNIPLEDALKKYEEGVGLARACQQKLITAEKKIEILTRTLSGTLKKEAFNPESESEPVRRKPRKNQDGGADKDLLI